MSVLCAGVVYYRLARPATESRDWKREYEGARAGLARSNSDSERLGFLAMAAEAGAEIGEFETAEKSAREALELLPKVPRDWNYGNVVHDVHTALGRVALKRGQIETAEAELLAAGRTPGSPQLNTFGPNMTLASELIRAGKRETVIAYFRECRAFWELGDAKLRRWEWMTRWHIPPDFGANFVF